MGLSQQDLKLLRNILSLSHQIEELWNASLSGEPSHIATQPMPEQVQLHLLADLVSAIHACDSAESANLHRLVPMAQHLHSGISLKHFIGIMVPFERLSSRALRDDDFLLLEDDVRRSTSATKPLVVVADNIRSAFNIGSILRTAECVGSEKVILSGYSSTPDDPKTAKTAMGTQESVKWEYVARVSDCLSALKKDGYTLIALETVHGAMSLFEFEFPERTALVLGNERFGLDPAILELVDEICRIPVFGVKNSLNVGIAFAVTAYEWRRQLDAKKKG